MSPALNDCITAAIAVICRTQEPDGAFPLHSRTDKDYGQDALPTTCFASALILDCLATLPTENRPTAAMEKTAGWLLGQRSSISSWNYHRRAEARFPDDLDDTFCTLAALQNYRPELVTGEMIAQAATILTSQEIAVGGPYRTWLAGPTLEVNENEVDLAVNSNIAYFLHCQDVTLPALVSQAESAIGWNYYASRYYPSPTAVRYFISRWYGGDSRSQLVNQHLQGCNILGNWNTPLATALTVSSLLRLGEAPATVAAGIHFLINTCSQNGWPAEDLYIDSIKKGQPTYAGSAGLTTAFCLEALEIYRQKTSFTPALPIRSQPELYGMIETIISTYPLDLAQELRKSALAMQAIDRNFPIVTLPLLAFQGLGQPANDSLFSRRVGLALAFGWMAYTLYDTISDSSASLDLLPVANCALREMTLAFASVLPDRPDFQEELFKTLARQEAANHWEARHARRAGIDAFFNCTAADLPDFGDYRVLAERSGGHGLGILAVAYYLNYPPGRIEALRRFLINLLIARQLNDDAHDWEEDLAQGLITVVTGSLLRTYCTRHGVLQLHESLMDIGEELADIFWRLTLEEVSRDIERHAGLAREALAGAEVANPEYFLSLLEPIERSAHVAREEQRRTLGFLSSYQPSPAT